MECFKPEDIITIEGELISVQNRYLDLLSRIFLVADNLRKEKAKEYLLHGVARRLGVIERCIENIYSIFPLRRKQLLSRNELKDIDINLHAFFANIFGILDNMAWVFVYEKGSAGKIRRIEVGLYKEELKDLLGDEFKEYLYSERMKRWHTEYLQNYRDALAHRIPLYVPPKCIGRSQKTEDEFYDEQIIKAIKKRDFNKLEKLQNKTDIQGMPCPYFVHSLREVSGKVVILHAQVIADFKTVEEIINKFCNNFLRT